MYKILEETLHFSVKFDFKKTNTLNFEKLINNICKGIVFILVKKNRGFTVEKLKRGHLKLENVSN